VDTIRTEVRDLLALHLADGLGPARIAALLDYFGSATQVRQASAASLAQVPGIGGQLSASLPAALRGADVETELQRIRAAGVDLLVRGEAGYPEALATIPGAPHLLFVRGALTATDARAVALVGTRHPTAYGKHIARDLAGGLARAGVTVVSGLARGIDGIAHQAALDAGGRTLAVLAGGLSGIYPPEHKGLAEAVAGRGALITESTMATEPLRGLFPARNRIISGLCRVVVIVQAAAKSGALITALHAAEQGRTVLAVPGPVDDDSCAGCNGLIRDGAVLCRGVPDVLEELDGVSPAARQPEVAPARQAQGPAGLDEVQQRIWDYLGSGPRAADEICRAVGVPVAPLSGLLLGLETKKVVRRLPGNRYERC
jgi:DNA processing protein